MTFFGLELLHRSSERGAVFGTDGCAFDPGDLWRVATMAPGPGQFIGLEAGSLDILAVPFARMTMACSLVVSACLEDPMPASMAALYSGV